MCMLGKMLFYSYFCCCCCRCYCCCCCLGFVELIQTYSNINNFMLVRIISGVDFFLLGSCMYNSEACMQVLRGVHWVFLFCLEGRKINGGRGKQAILWSLWQSQKQGDVV